MFTEQELKVFLAIYRHIHRMADTVTDMLDLEEGIDHITDITEHSISFSTCLDRSGDREYLVIPTNFVADANWKEKYQKLIFEERENKRKELEAVKAHSIRREEQQERALLAQLKQKYEI